MRMRFLCCMTMVGLAVSDAWAQCASIALDGSKDTDYGSALSVQTCRTSYGDNSMANAGCPTNGSELDAAYGRIHNGTLYLLLAGNLESNGNRLVVFIDSVSGGQNTLSGTIDSGDTLAHLGTNGGNGNWGGAGLTFDAGFQADYAIAVNVT